MSYNLAASPSEMLRVHIVARLLGYSRRSVRRFIETGELPAQRFGQRAWLVMRADVEQLRHRRG